MSSNSRTSQRAPVVLKIKFKSANLDQFIQRYSVDVSHGGIFIRTKKPLSVGQTLRFEFRLKDASPLILGEGTVIWTREPMASRPDVAPGMGVRFDKLEGESRKIIEKVLREKDGSSDERFEPASSGAEPEDEVDAGDEFGDVSTKVAPEDLVQQLAYEESNETPLPAPTPFQSDAADFSQETFEESTRVAPLDAMSLSELGRDDEIADAAPLATPPQDQNEPEKSESKADPPVEESKLEPSEVSEPALTESAKATDVASGKGARKKAPVTTPPPPPGAENTETPKRARVATVLPPQAQTEEPKKSGALVPLLILVAIVGGLGYWWMQRGNKESTQVDTVSDTGETTEQAEPAPAAEEKEDEAPKVSVNIMSDPPGANILMPGGGVKGPTPMSLELGADESVEVVVSRPGFWMQNISVEPANAGTDVEVKLKAKPVKVKVTTEPRGAAVYVDGRRHPGRTPLLVALKGIRDEGVTLLIKRAGHEDLKSQISPSNFEDNPDLWLATVNEALVPLPKAGPPVRSTRPKAAPKPAQAETKAVAPAAPKPDDESAAESAPAQPAPVKPAPVKPAPVKPAPVEPAEAVPAAPKAEQAPASPSATAES